jgi:hypothetical protein
VFQQCAKPSPENLISGVCLGAFRSAEQVHLNVERQSRTVVERGYCLSRCTPPKAN